MPTEKILLGPDAILTIGSAEVEDATDVTIVMSPNMISTPTRKTARNGFNSKSPGQIDHSIQFKYLAREGETLTGTLLSAIFNRTILTAEALDSEGGQGPSGDYYVSKCERGEPLEGGIGYDCELTWTADNGADAPEWTGVEAGVLPAPSMQFSVSATIPAGKAGTLTTRTDNDTGVATMASGHGIETGNKVDVYWTGGIRYGMDATVSGTAVTVDGGAGDNLPSQSTGVVLSVQVTSEYEISGDSLGAFLRINSQKRGHISFLDSGGSVLWAIEILAGLQYEWLYSDPYAVNPLAGAEVASVAMSNGNSGDNSLFSVVAS